MKEDKKYARGQGKRDSLVRLSRILLIMYFVSFGGWALETVMHYAIYEEFTDRGFLSLPFCPIYGISVVIIAYTLGTPQKLDGILEREMMRAEKLSRVLRRAVPRTAIYFLSVTVISTLAELIVGAIFTAMDTPLWDYSDKPLNLFGIVCLPYSILWGIMITAFMGLLWPRLVKCVSKIPGTVSIISAAVLTVAALADFIVNITLRILK